MQVLAVPVANNPLSYAAVRTPLSKVATLRSTHAHNLYEESDSSTDVHARSEEDAPSNEMEFP
jgi:hypothetical protein